ncbi:hypothetical protein FAZ19_15220 [Sphingobacterium alkalisoli]|uniref:Lipocalin-like domain-containing protein n=2 Tax=Sphingobacterium alkalisoli TaxID=1874115 RepID=A0A4U0GZ83_9SPHI|nr:hypothetical protein [Sphingobacterium alkalisoli]TJY64541.1 hypothetical protein FAZ19_15220 [Sphingobacterium alkalisoli]GGH21087.1 hypothetical protein GCM10011418_26750 [Sphingobacterium alkalisoli]
MKKSTLYLVFAALGSNLVIAAVWHESPIREIPNSPFGNHYWAVSSATIEPALDLDMDGKPDSDLRALVPDCEGDDADRYLEDGTIVTDRGSKSCDIDEERQEETGTWSYDPSTRVLVMEKYDGSRPVHSHLESVSSTQIIFISRHSSAKGIHTVRTILKVKGKT